MGEFEAPLGKKARARLCGLYKYLSLLHHCVVFYCINVPNVLLMNIWVIYSL